MVVLGKPNNKQTYDNIENTEIYSHVIGKSRMCYKIGQNLLCDAPGILLSWNWLTEKTGYYDTHTWSGRAGIFGSH